MLDEPRTRPSVRTVHRWPVDESHRGRTERSQRSGGASVLEHLADIVLDAGRKRHAARRLVWLDSGGPLEDVRRTSIITAFPSRTLAVGPEASAADTRALLQELSVPPVATDSSLPGGAEGRPSPRFTGGWIGFVSYEAVTALEPVDLTSDRDLDVPLASWAWHDTWVRHDDVERCLVLETISPDDPMTDEQGRELPSLDAWCHWVEEALRAPYDHTTPMWTPPQRLRTSPEAPPMPEDLSIAGYTASLGRAAFRSAVLRVQEAIREGEVFQANVAQRLSTDLDMDPFRLHIVLRRNNPSPFGAYIEEAWGTIISNSPERLVCLHGTPRDGGGQGRRIVVRPIAGTRPRHPDPAEDERLVDELRDSLKERAEHTMLVDLLRNDVGRIAVAGSVRVTAHHRIEGYSHVHHLVSDIEGEARADVQAIDVLQALFPGGTITGAPKLRSIEVIDAVEPVMRGPYTGSLGYISANGDIDLNILIRTCLVADKRAHVGVGAGIVADSDPETEFQETLHKARAIIGALETVKAEPIIPWEADRHAS